MTFSINEFKSKFDTINGFARTNKFLVLITPPPWASSGKANSDTKDVLPYLCESANLPGLSFTFSEIRHHGMGPIERRPDVPIYTEMPLTFLASGDGRVFEFFHQWAQNIINIGSTHKPVNGFPYKGAYLYEAHYPDNYLTTVDIISYNDSEDRIITYTLQDAFPSTIADTAVNWGATDEVMRLQISLTYKSWYATSFAEADFSSGSLRGRSTNLSFLQILSTAGSAINTIKSITKPTNVVDALNQVQNLKGTASSLGGLRQATGF